MMSALRAHFPLPLTVLESRIDERTASRKGKP